MSRMVPNAPKLFFYWSLSGFLRKGPVRSGLQRTDPKKKKTRVHSPCNTVYKVIFQCFFFNFDELILATVPRTKGIYPCIYKERQQEPIKRQWSLTKDNILRTTTIPPNDRNSFFLVGIQLNEKCNKTTQTKKRRVTIDKNRLLFFVTSLSLY